jgi:hypothetical protein
VAREAGRCSHGIEAYQLRYIFQLQLDVVAVMRVMAQMAVVRDVRKMPMLVMSMVVVVLRRGVKDGL